MKALFPILFVLLSFPLFSHDYLVIDTTQADLQRYTIHDTLENCYPMSTIEHDIDINDDGIIDFTFRSSGSMGGGGGHASMQIWTKGDNFYVSDTMVIDSTIYALSPNVVDTFEIVKPFEYEDTIWHADYFIGDTTAVYIWWEVQYPPAELDVDIWFGGEKYMAIKKIMDDVVYYGWIKLDVRSVMYTYILESAIYFTPFYIPEIRYPEVMIYPNPASHEVKVSVKNASIDKIMIYTIAGQKVSESPTGQNTIDISYLQPGMYIVEVIVAGRKVRQKLVVE